jgi:hypothetical protein
MLNGSITAPLIKKLNFDVASNFILEEEDYQDDGKEISGIRTPEVALSKKSKRKTEKSRLSKGKPSMNTDSPDNNYSPNGMK